MAKKGDDEQDFGGGLKKHPDGHWLLGGARWHYPVAGDPQKCAVEGCTRVLGEAARLAALAAQADAEADPSDEDEPTIEAPEAAEPALSADLA